MKIKAKQITKGMSIRVSSVEDIKYSYLRTINLKEGDLGYDFLSSLDGFEEQKVFYQKLIDEKKTLSVQRGSIKKASPTLKINDVDFSTSYSYYNGTTTVTINIIMLDTDMGFVQISTRQTVELL